MSPLLLLLWLWGPLATLAMTSPPLGALAFRFCQLLPAPFSLVIEGRGPLGPQEKPPP